MKRRWTQADYDFIKDNWPNVELIAQELDRSILRVKRIARERLGLSLDRPGNWTTEEDDYIKNFWPNRKALEEYLPNRSWNSLRHRAVLFKLLKQGKAEVNYLDLKLPPKYTDQELFRKLVEWQETCKLLSTHQDEITVEITGEEPIILCFMADLHIGAVSGYYKELYEVSNLLHSAPNTFVVIAGDTTDNYLPTWHPSGSFSAIVPPEIQKRLVQYVVEQFKVIAYIQGCHDEASHTTDDFDWTKYLTEKYRCANLGFGGFMNLQMGKQTYRIHARHKYRYSSSFNFTHTVKRMREHLGDFDIGCVAHHHLPAIEEVPLADGITRVFIRPGSFKGADRYARQMGYTGRPAEYATPSVVLFPNERRMIPFLKIRDAITVLNSLL